MSKNKKFNKKALAAGFVVFAGVAYFVGSASSASAVEIEYGTPYEYPGIGELVYAEDFRCSEPGVGQIRFDILSDKAFPILYQNNIDEPDNRVAACNYILNNTENIDWDGIEFSSADIGIDIRSTTSIIKTYSLEHNVEQSGRDITILPSSNISLDLKGFSFKADNLNISQGSFLGLSGAAGHVETQINNQGALLFDHSDSDRGNYDVTYKVRVATLDGGSTTAVGDYMLFNPRALGEPIFYNTQGSKVNIEGGVYTGLYEVGMGKTSSLISNSGDLTIYGGKFSRVIVNRFVKDDKRFVDFWNEPHALINQYTNRDTTLNTTTIIKGGTFETTDEGGMPVGTLFGSNNGSGSSGIVSWYKIEGGNFAGRNIFVSTTSNNEIIELHGGNFVYSDSFYFYDSSFIESIDDPFSNSRAIFRRVDEEGKEIGVYGNVIPGPNASYYTFTNVRANLIDNGVRIEDSTKPEIIEMTVGGKAQLLCLKTNECSINDFVRVFNDNITGTVNVGGLGGRARIAGVDAFANPNVVSVQNGEITANAKGFTRIDVRLEDGTTHSYMVVVKDDENVDISDDEVDFEIEAGKSMALELPEGSTIEYESTSNDKICKIENGSVVGVSEGKCAVNVIISRQGDTTSKTFLIKVAKATGDVVGGDAAPEDKTKNPDTLDRGQAVAFTVAGSLLAALGVSFVKIRKMFGR